MKFKVNVDDTVDKSSSRTTVQPVTQPKAPTDLKLKKKKILPFFEPKSSHKVRVILLKKQVADTQPAEKIVATADATKSLDTSESAEEQVNQRKTIEAEKIMDESDQKNKAAEKPKSPFDTESEIKIIKRDGDFDSRLHSMPDYDLVSMTGFEIPNSADDDSKEGTGETFYAFADMTAQSDPLGHLYEELRIFNSKIDQLESSITDKCLIERIIKTKVSKNSQNRQRNGKDKTRVKNERQSKAESARYSKKRKQIKAKDQY
ncbi:hypothetical protein Tco_1452874 [Tanacetum coccineum]